MQKYTLLIAILFMLPQHYLFSQEEKERLVEIEGTEYVLFTPSRELESEIRNGLQVRYSLIKLKVHPGLHLDSAGYAFYTALLDTFQFAGGSLFTESTTIHLKNGLSWNLDGDPPSEPRNFNRKAMTRKGRVDKAVIDRLKYLQFCYAWKTQDAFPREMVDRFTSFQSIKKDGVLYFESIFELKFRENKGTQITRKEISLKMNE